jgi:transcriptional regulator GlxA family with amidase domain
LRTLGRHRDALHELDVAFELARSTGTANALIEFLEYDRSIVLDSLGEYDAARASYRRYLQLINAQNRSAESLGTTTNAKQRAPLEPYFLKRADRFIVEHLQAHFTIAALAKHCGVGWRTLESAFSTFRGTTPVSFVRNLRLDRAHAELAAARCEAGVAAIASRYGFRSPTTFSLEYRKRFGIAPSKTRRIARTPDQPSPPGRGARS